MYQEEVDVAAESNLLNTLLDGCQSLLNVFPGTLRLCDDEEILAVDRVRVRADCLANLLFIMVLLSSVECPVAYGERMVDRGRVGDASCTKYILGSLRRKRWTRSGSGSDRPLTLTPP
jgi:hypothetical protein